MKRVSTLIPTALATCVFIFVLFAAHAATAPQGVRIPRPRRERPAAPTPTATPTNSPATPQPGNTNAPSDDSSNRAAALQPLPALLFDDGYTFFTLRNKVDYVGGKPITKGWSLVSQLRLVGPVIPRRSAFKVVVARGGQALATTQCEGNIPALRSNFDGREADVMTVNCYDDTQLANGEGKFSVEVRYVSGDDFSERPLRTYEIEVRKVDRVRGEPTRPQADAPHFYISRHGEVLSSILYLRPGGFPPYIYDVRPDTFARNRVEVVYNVSTTEEGQGIGAEGFLRCTVDGQKLELARDEVSNQRPTPRAYQEIYTDRLAPEFQRGTEYRDEINFRQYYALLPLTWGRNRDNFFTTALDDHPGKWECTYRVGANVVRTWRWTVRRDGSVVPHTEERADLTFLPNAYLVETEIPAGGSFIDRRLYPEAVRAGFFYGHRWQTAEGRAVAAKVPAKGKPWPVPSNAR